MRITLAVLLAFVALLTFDRPAVAHHSFAAEFDGNQPITVNGSVSRMDWVNPHSWIYVDVKDAGGQVVTWRFEMGPPNALLRMGWRKNSIPPGTLVKIEGYRAKSGKTRRERQDGDASGWPRAVLRRLGAIRAHRGSRGGQAVAVPTRKLHGRVIEVVAAAG